MGKLREVKCKSCAYQATFLEGVGFADESLQNIAARFEPKIAAHILAIAKNFVVDEYDYTGQKTAYCPQCGSLQCIPVISVKYNQSSEFNYGRNCEKCGTGYHFIDLNEEINNLPCPECHTPHLYQSGSGMWD
ncbi:MAG: hypothetical protein LBR56_01155 [Sporomusaceae bacterium]|jgi:Zn finger protein HypA/HybF involved in hydrogenase expression|nr:hypothetical protein [Sporomusaceae bacterium]